MNYKKWIEYKSGIVVREVDDTGDWTNKYGLIDKNETIILPVEYEYVTCYDELERIKVHKDGKYGLLDVNCNQIVPLIYTRMIQVTIQGKDLFIVSKESSDEWLIDRDGHVVVITYKNADGQVFYADKFSSNGAMLFSKARVLYMAGHHIPIDEITCYSYYSRSYSGNGTTSVTDKKLVVTNGKLKEYCYDDEKYAGPSWDDYADVMESDDETECYISTRHNQYKVHIDWTVWEWLKDYFPPEE